MPEGHREDPDRLPHTGMPVEDTGSPASRIEMNDRTLVALMAAIIAGGAEAASESQKPYTVVSRARAILAEVGKGLPS